MKHNWKITIFLLALFLISHIAGLLIVREYIPLEKDVSTGKYTYNISKVQDLPEVGNMEMARPEFEKSSHFLIYIVIAIIVGTSIILLLSYFKKPRVWKIWFFLAIIFALYYAIAPFIKKLLMLFNIPFSSVVSLLVIFGIGILGYFKVYKPNVYVHNLTEIFMYGGLAAIFIPLEIITIWVIIGLLLIISIYDAIAVWQSKHMIKLAKFQTDSKAFAGLFIPYKKPKKIKYPSKVKTKKVKNALLGGGDIAFTLFFSAVLMKTYGFWQAALVSVIITFSLFLLFYFAKKDRFYPAMPFLTAGCLVGYLVVLLL